MAWATASSGSGSTGESKIHKVDANDGRGGQDADDQSLRDRRLVVDGALWHGASGDGKPCKLRRLASDGTVEGSLAVPVAEISGVEAALDGTFWCGGAHGELRQVGRKGKH